MSEADAAAVAAVLAEDEQHGEEAAWDVMDLDPTAAMRWDPHGEGGVLREEFLEIAVSLVSSYVCLRWQACGTARCGTGGRAQGWPLDPPAGHFRRFGCVFPLARA